jgi:tRNA(Ile)-lysidine synthase
VIERVRAAIDRFPMMAPGRIGAAVSGGADSVFLLYALRELDAAAAVLHVNHGLRGVDSDRDEDFVRDLAQRFELPFYILVAPVFTGNTEQEARRLRYEFFAEHIAAGHCETVATGHTLDDQAETVLYRFLRGAGTAGLSGIRPTIGQELIRPLLSLRREEIRAWLKERGIPWREDQSNLNPEIARNRIRFHHLPELAASLNPALPQVLAATAEWARGEEDYWEAELDRIGPRYLIHSRETVLIDTRAFCELSAAVQRRLLRRAFAWARGSLRSIDFRHVEAVRALMSTREGSGRLQLPDLDVYRSFDWLRLAPPGIDTRLERDFEVTLQTPGRTEIPERLLSIEIELVGPQPVYNDEVDGLDRERCAGTLVLRNWRPGDQFHRKDRSSAEKIKTLFQEYRIPLWERRNWPVIARGGSILWTRRFGVAAEYAASPQSRNILLIREAGESNPAPGTSTEVKRASGFPSSGEPGAEVM